MTLEVKVLVSSETKRTSPRAGSKGFLIPGHTTLRPLDLTFQINDETILVLFGASILFYRYGYETKLRSEQKNVIVAVPMTNYTYSKDIKKAVRKIQKNKLTSMKKTLASPVIMLKRVHSNINLESNNLGALAALRSKLAYIDTISIPEEMRYFGLRHSRAVITSYMRKLKFGNNDLLTSTEKIAIKEAYRRLHNLISAVGRLKLTEFAKQSSVDGMSDEWLEGKSLTEAIRAINITLPQRNFFIDCVNAYYGYGGEYLTVPMVALRYRIIMSKIIDNLSSL